MLDTLATADSLRVLADSLPALPRSMPVLTGDPIADMIGSLGVGGASVWFLLRLADAWSKRKDKAQDAEIKLQEEAAKKAAETEQSNREEYRTMTLERLDRHTKALSDLFALGRADSEAIKELLIRFGGFAENLSVKMDDILHGSAGNLTRELVRNHVGIFSGKLHFEIYFWWQQRLIENHVLVDPDRVGRKYAEQLTSIIDRWKFQLESYKYKGTPMLAWDPELEGMSKLYRELFARLFDDQVALAKNERPFYANPMTALDHMQSRLMGSAVRWATSGKLLVTDLEEERDNALNSAGIEFLEDIKERA